MPKLKLFRDIDPLNSDAIPFPRARQDTDRFRLRLAGGDDPIGQAERALDSLQARLDKAQLYLSGAWFDDDGPRAA